MIFSSWHYHFPLSLQSQLDLQLSSLWVIWASFPSTLAMLFYKQSMVISCLTQLLLRKLLIFPASQLETLATLPHIQSTNFLFTGYMLPIWLLSESCSSFSVSDFQLSTYLICGWIDLSLYAWFLWNPLFFPEVYCPLYEGTFSHGHHLCSSPIDHLFFTLTLIGLATLRFDTQPLASMSLLLLTLSPGPQNTNTLFLVLESNLSTWVVSVDKMVHHAVWLFLWDRS